MAPGSFPWKLYPEDSCSQTDWRLTDGNIPLPVKSQVRPIAPYKSLASFTSDDAEIFFGRKAEIRDLYNHVIDERGPSVIFVYGQSGVGKSSLLEAGLIPRLKSKNSIAIYRGNRQIIQLLEDLIKYSEECKSQETKFDPWSHIFRSKKSTLVIIIEVGIT